ncbi:MAG: FecR domain-containing protein [Acidobacteriota bacterium]
MTTPTRDDDSNSYLWDRSGKIDPAVADLERVLGPIAYKPAERPLALPTPIVLQRRRWPMLVALAAGLLLVTAGWLFYWRLQWPAGRPWRMAVATESGARIDTLAVGQSLKLDANSSASVDIARLGTMSVQPGAEVTLRTTGSRRHQLRLDRGAVHIRVWAPPQRVFVATPAGNIIDLGCTFTLAVDDSGTARLTVQTGWVQMENVHGESLVPAGASSVMTADRSPLVPLYDDASPEFQRAVRAFETRVADDNVSAELAAIRRDARVRDMLTLLMLAVRERDTVRASLLEHAATLSPPPRTLSGNPAAFDSGAIWEWRGSLPLPPPKAWWRNWADVFPAR